MNAEVYSVLLLLHVLSMAVWFAGSFFTTSDIKKSLALGGAYLQPMVARVNAAERLSLTSGMLTVITGLALIFAGGGFTAMPLRIHIGFALTIITFFVGALFASPTWRRIAGIVERNADINEAVALSKRMSMFMGIEHLLRTVVMVLMVVQF